MKFKKYILTGTLALLLLSQATGIGFSKGIKQMQVVWTNI